MFIVLLHRVRAYISRHFLLTHGQRLAVGVSGGPDSIALLHLLTRLRADYGLKLIVAHLHHGLRPEADGDAEFVTQTASEWDVECVVERVDVAALASAEHLSVEEAGRKSRYVFFARIAPTVAVAHNADDQVETVLMHLLRGSGMAGLRGMLPKSSGQWSVVSDQTIIRPLLAVSRAEIEAYLAAHELEYRTDATNADTTFFRNRLRHELLPFLETYNPNIREILFRTADVMAGEYELLRGVIEKAWDDTLAGPSGAAVTFDLLRWRALPLTLQRALLREAVHRLRPGLRNVDFTPVDNAVHWSQTTESGHTADLLGGLCVKVVGSEMCVCAWDQSPRESSNLQSPISNLFIPGETSFLNHTFTVTLLDSFSLADIASNPNPWTAYLDAGLAPFALRTRRPGDRFEPLGMHGTTRLSDFMINRKMPVDAREGWPLLACGEKGETVLWVCGYAVSERAKVTKNTGRVVKVTMRPSSAKNTLSPEGRGPA